jgi:hypothetical protein
MLADLWGVFHDELRAGTMQSHAATGTAFGNSIMPLAYCEGPKDGPTTPCSLLGPLGVEHGEETLFGRGARAAIVRDAGRGVVVPPA